MTEEQEQIILDSMWVVNSVLKELGLQGDEDMRSFATLSLCKYINEYDASKGVKWTTYAYKCIRGVLIREKRKQLKHDKHCVSDTAMVYVQDATDYEEQSNAQIIVSLIREQLTPLEQQILDFKLADMPFCEIAKQLGLSRQTILKHWDNIKEVATQFT